MELGASPWRRYVALGDSLTEGLSDPDPDRPGAFRGWADRLADHLAAAAPDALAATLEGAVVRLRAAGADVLLATGVDTRRTPILRRVRGKIAIFNAHVWSIASRSGAVVLDQWGADWLQDWRMWDADRIHLTDEGHRRVALAAAAALGLPGAGGDDWRRPLPPADPRPFRVAVAEEAEEAAWVRGFVAPWIGRRLRGRSSGDGRAPKRPVPLGLPRP